MKLTKNSNINYSGKIDFFGALTLLFIALKLLNYIDWSWYWVLAPLWIPIALVLLIVMVIILFFKHKKNDIKKVLNDLRRQKQ